MDKKKLFRSLFLLLIFIITSSCTINADESGIAPYKLEGEFVCDKDSEKYSKGAIKCSFTNKGEKTVKKMYIVFLLFDENGEPLQQNVIAANACIPKMMKAEFLVSLDDYLPKEANENYYVDFIYASKIIYEDNSEWDDPLGLLSFM